MKYLVHLKDIESPVYDNNYFYPVYSNYAYFDDKKSGVPLQAYESLQSYLYGLIALKFLEKFLSEMFQNICFSFYYFRDMHDISL